MITVMQKGYFTTIQDAGRWGYQAYGMPIAGAMDQYAYRIANLLVGNDHQAAVIEMTEKGAAFKFDEEQYVAVCGADMQGKLNNNAIVNWSAFLVPRRGVLKFNETVTGYRTYLAVHGGIDVLPVLKSRSTYTTAKIGGHEGRTLHQGDVLYVGREAVREALSQKLLSKFIPRYLPDITLRVLMGPQNELFTKSAIETFFNGSYTVSPQSDRSGYFLNGPKLITKTGKTDIISDAVSLGAIQVPSDGMPFIVAADHQTTRGFAKLGYVIQADLSKIAQARPGTVLHFTGITEADAIAALRCERQCYLDITKLVSKKLNTFI